MTAELDHTPRLPRAYGKYELLERIGRGGMAEVFRARLPGIAGFEKTLVIKRLHPRFTSSPGFVQMFIDEAKLAAQVQHKNVVQVFELGSLDSGELFIAMEYVDGSDLKGLIVAARRAGQHLPVWFSLHAVVEVLDALAFAHDLEDEAGQRRNIVHNDVTPENVFVARHGDVKLGDFGVAHDDTRTSDPFPGQMKGKVPYMSPEQLSGLKPDARSDVFAAGIVLWECLTQRRLFSAATQSETMARICGAPRPRPSRFNPKVPRALDEVVLSALEVDRDRRIPNARALQEALLDVLATTKRRVDAADVRALVGRLAGPSSSARHAPLRVEPPPAPDDVELELEEPEIEPPSMSADEAASALASPTATGEFPAFSDPPPRPTPAASGAPARLDVIREPPPLRTSTDDVPAPPRRRPPPPPPATHGGQSTGSLADGFTYTILHPSHAREDVNAEPSEQEAAGQHGEVDALLEQFLAEKFAEEPSNTVRAHGPLRRMLTAARQVSSRTGDSTPLPALEAHHPFWVRFPDGREVGPLEPAVLLRYLGSRPYEDAVQALVTADQVRWVSTARLTRLLGEDLVPDNPQMGQCSFLGTLKGHSLTAVLGELARTRATGRLVLYRETEGGRLDRREVHVREGALTAVSENRATFTMWESLLSSPFFTDRHLPESLYTAIRIQRPVSQLLPADAAAGVAQARGLLARQQLREIYKWENASFGFDPNAEPLEGRATPLLRLLPRLVRRSLSSAQLRRAVDPFMDTPLERAPEFAQEVLAMDFHRTELERIEPLGHGYTLGESLAQSAPLADDRYALVISYVLLELRLLRPQRQGRSANWRLAGR